VIESAFWLVKLVVRGGGRTTDLPLFRMKDDRPRPTILVCRPCSVPASRHMPATNRGRASPHRAESDKSQRTIALPAQLGAALRAHRAAQLAERMTAEPAWEDTDLVWCKRNGRPIGHHADWDEWKSLLKAVGIRDARVHDARHTAASLLLAQGVGQRVVMQILGHSQISMTSKYAHVLPQVMTDAADRIGEALWREANCNQNCNWQPAKIT
jgi:integrase